MIGLGLFPEWSPVSDSIVYQRARERGGRWFSIWRIDLDNGEPKFPVEVAASSDMALIQPSWSPDGQWVTYGTAQVGTGSDLPEESNSAMARGDIWIIRADGSSPIQLTDGTGVNFSSVWGSDNRVYFTSLQNGCENVWSVRPLNQPSERLTAATVETNTQSAANVPTPEPAGTAQTAGQTRHGG
jgi:TolB protein